jgi:hypothetical protein
MAQNSGSLALYLANTFINLPAGVSGNLYSFVEYARMHIQNWTGYSIDPNGIPDNYVPPILDFAKADVIDMNNADGAGGRNSIGELSIDEAGGLLSAQQYRLLGDMKLKAIGRAVRFARALSA